MRRVVDDAGGDEVGGGWSESEKAGVRAAGGSRRRGWERVVCLCRRIVDRVRALVWSKLAGLTEGKGRERRLRGGMEDRAVERRPKGACGSGHGNTRARKNRRVRARRELVSSMSLLPREVWMTVLGQLDMQSLCHVSGLDSAMRNAVTGADAALFRRFWRGATWAVDEASGFKRALLASSKLSKGAPTAVDWSDAPAPFSSCVQALANADVLIGGMHGVSLLERSSRHVRSVSSSPVAFFGREPLSAREVIAVTVDRAVCIVDAERGERALFRFEADDGEPLDTAAPPDGEFVAVGFCSGTVRLAWRAGRQLKLRMAEPADCLAAAKDVIAAASFTAPTKVLVWSAKTGSVLQRFDACTGGFDLANIGGIEMVNPKCVLIWDSRRVLYEAFVENGFVRRLAETSSTGVHIGRGKVCISPDGTKAVAAGAKAAILVNLRNGHIERKLDAHYAQVKFTPDGKIVIAAQGKPYALSYNDVSELPYLMLFDAETGDLLRKIRMQGTLKQFSVAGSTIAGVQRGKRDQREGIAVAWQFA